MRYIVRKILSFLLPVAILITCINGMVCGFATYHYYIVGFCGVFMALMACAKLIRKIIYFPINMLRKVLFRV